MKRQSSAAGMLVSLCATSAFAATDNFNRTELTHPGPFGSVPWEFEAGKLFIVNNELQGTSGAEGVFIDEEGILAQSATVKVTLHGTGLQFGAITIGLNVDTDAKAFVKIQSQNGTGMFDHVAFYTGINGSGPFMAMTSPMASPATMTVSMIAGLAILTIKSSSGTQVYTHAYGTWLTGTGLGTFGSVSLDNFITPTTVPPASAAASIQPVWVPGSNAADLTH
jgi:hypothetical protein